jgi:hypothetical protein
MEAAGQGDVAMPPQQPPSDPEEAASPESGVSEIVEQLEEWSAGVDESTFAEWCV